MAVVANFSSLTVHVLLINAGNIEPPRFVSPWINPNILKPKYRPNEFVELKTLEINPPLGKVKRRNIPTIIPMLLPILFAKNKPIGINGNADMMNVLVNFRLISSLSSNTCVILINNDVGNKKLRTSKKGYPNESNKGVPNSRTPTPNTDCTTDARSIINIISTGRVIINKQYFCKILPKNK